MYKKKFNILDFCSKTLSVIMMIFLSIYVYLSNGTSLNGGTILLAICMNFYPIKNLYSINTKKIKSRIYYILLSMYSLSVISISVVATSIYYSNYQSDFGNASRIFFSEYLVYMLVSAGLLIILPIFIQKETLSKNGIHNKIKFLIIGILALTPCMYDTMNILIAISFGNFIFNIIMMFKSNNFYVREELQKIYIAIGLLCLITCNVIGFYILIYMYLELDKIVINI